MSIVQDKVDRATNHFTTQKNQREGEGRCLHPLTWFGCEVIWSIECFHNGGDILGEYLVECGVDVLKEFKEACFGEGAGVILDVGDEGFGDSNAKVLKYGFHKVAFKPVCVQVLHVAFLRCGRGRIEFHRHNDHTGQGEIFVPGGMGSTMSDQHRKAFEKMKLSL
jgi:hypothetical protein